MHGICILAERVCDFSFRHLFEFRQNEDFAFNIVKFVQYGVKQTHGIGVFCGFLGIAGARIGNLFWVQDRRG